MKTEILGGVVITCPAALVRRRETSMKYSSVGKNSFLTTFHKATTEKVVKLGFFSLAFAL